MCLHDGPVRNKERKIRINDRFKACTSLLTESQQVAMIMEIIHSLPERSMSSSSLELLSFALFFPISPNHDVW